MSICTHKGFTLTEVIVVSVIVAILAISAIPVYSGFITDASYKAAEGSCELVATAIAHAHNRGLSILTAGDWDALGVADPSDDNWTYTLTPLDARNSIGSDYAVTVVGKTGTRYSGKTGYFYLRPPRWVKPQ
jgi:prepilin-type N-terminal cleavage/methylation domain-containing protein